MLDTLILTIPRVSYRVTSPEMFTPSTDILARPGNFLVKCVNNPTKADKDAGIYKPRLTLMKRPGNYQPDIPLKIEFSAPKLIFGNNLDELTENHFENVIFGLRTRLGQMGVEASLDAISQAQVSALHASKNISLADGYTSSYVIGELKKINLSRFMDMNKADFRNEGQVLQYYSNAHAVVLYDKVRDLTKPAHRATDKDQTANQLSLFKELSATSPEILRLEIRLSKKYKLKSVLKGLGYKSEPTLRSVFKKDVCQKIVQHYWQQMVGNETLFLFDTTSHPQKIFRQIAQHSPNLGCKDVIRLVGLKLLCRDMGGIREFRQILEEHYSDRTWYRVKKDFDTLSNLTEPDNQHSWLKQINDAVERFEPFKMQIGSVNHC